MVKWIITIFARTWVVYAMMFVFLVCNFKADQVSDDMLNTSRPSADYLHFFSYGTKAFDEGKFKSAVGYYQTLVRGKIATALVYGNLGYSYYYLKDTQKAIKMYQKAMALDPRIYAFYYDLGIIYLEQKKFALAQEMFKKAIVLMPESKADLLKMLHIQPKHQDHIAYEYYFQQRVPWDRLMAYVHVLETLDALKAYDQMVNIALKGINAFPQDPELVYYAALGSFATQHIKEALVFINRALELSPGFAKGYILRSHIWELVRDQEAIKADAANYKQYQDKSWARQNEITELHHWDENTILFQIYN